MTNHLSKTFLAKITSITSNCEDHEMVVPAMKRMMSKTIKKLQMIYVKDLMQTLYQRSMGTAYVTNLSNKLCSENISKRKTIIKLSMKEKLADA